MMLSWIRTYERIDNTTMREVFVEHTKNYTMSGGIVVLCTVCKQWVPKFDHEEFCLAGFHEQSRVVTLKPAEIDNRVAELMQKEHEKKIQIEK